MVEKIVQSGCYSVQLERLVFGMDGVVWFAFFGLVKYSCIPSFNFLLSIKPNL